jgi:hypothetical protein
VLSTWRGVHTLGFAKKKKKGGKEKAPPNRQEKQEIGKRIHSITSTVVMGQFHFTSCLK